MSLIWLKRVAVWASRLIGRWWSWALLGLANLLLTAGKDVLEKGFEPLTITLFAVGAILIVRDLNGASLVRGIFNPKYSGLQEYLKRLDSSPQYLKSFVTKNPGKIEIDAVRLVESCYSEVERIDLCGTDPSLNKIGALMNTHAFAGSRYQDKFEAKFSRNAAMAAVNPACFALVRDIDDAERHNGLTGVVPIDPESWAPYVTGQLHDNDFDAVHVAGKGRPFRAVLLFLIANMPVKGGVLAKRVDQKSTLDDLVKLCLLQLVLIAASAKRSKDILVVAANAGNDMISLFKNLNLTERREFNSADGERMFAASVTIQRASEAARLIAARNKGVAQLYPGFVRKVR